MQKYDKYSFWFDLFFRFKTKKKQIKTNLIFWFKVPFRNCLFIIILNLVNLNNYFFLAKIKRPNFIYESFWLF